MKLLNNERIYFLKKKRRKISQLFSSYNQEGSSMRKFNFLFSSIIYLLNGHDE